MIIFATVLEIVAPVFILASIGFIWVKAGFEYRLNFVTTLSMTLAVPALIFTSLMETKIETTSLSSLLFASIAAYGVLTAAVWIGVKLLKKETSVLVAPIIFGNTGNLGLPLAFFAFGQVGLSYAVIVFAVMAVWSFTFGIWLVSGGGSIFKALREPIVGATLLGALFLWQGWETPVFMTNALRLVGQMAIPLMLITLGVAVARMSPNRLGTAFAISIIKFVICTAIAWIIGIFFTLEPIAFAVLVIQIATPVAVTSYLLAAKYGRQSDDIAGLVVASTLLSVGYLPLLLAVLLP
ncbi:MAG: AEC family transporter [Paracoccaceae bacterium]|nr:AEC family transporter [Paracoccaceae bacterium]MDG2260152.1 AEC family transporter [Paracoccaceae bacterium]